MILQVLDRVGPGEAAAVRALVGPERPGYDTVAGHVLNTGHGSIAVDRWPNPATVLIESAGNLILRGSPPAAWDPVPAGFVDAPPQFLPGLRKAASRLTGWDRVVFVLNGRPPEPGPVSAGYTIRRLVAADAEALAGAAPWLARTWRGPAALLAGGHAWGAFADSARSATIDSRRAARDAVLVSVASTFFLGDRHEELGVYTRPEHTGRGLSTACASALCADIQARGRRPSWSTSTDNAASQRVAVKLGFSHVRDDVLYVVNRDPPAA